MVALRVCVGTVSSEQRSSNGSSADALRSAGAASIAIAEATTRRRDNDRCMLLLLFVLRGARSRPGGSDHQAGAGGDQQQVDGDLELPVGQAPEDAQPEPGAEQRGRNERERVPVELRGGRRRRP